MSDLVAWPFINIPRLHASNFVFLVGDCFAIFLGEVFPDLDFSCIKVTSTLNFAKYFNEWCIHVRMMINP